MQLVSISVRDWSLLNCSISTCLIVFSVPISFVYVAGYLICTSGLPWPLCGSLVGVLMYSVPYLADFVHHVVLFTEYHCHYMF